MAAPDFAAQAAASPFRMAAKAQPDSTYTGEEYEL
jgi:hypothetical protein